MCGIGFIANVDDRIEISQDLQGRIAAGLRNRGNNEITALKRHRHWFSASVLHIQGSIPATQPHIDRDTGAILLWNGEVFGGLEELDDISISDTFIVSQHLSRILRTSPEYFLSEMVTFFAGIHGPFSFIYFLPELDAVFYGRDSFGRRSLLRLSDEQHEWFALSSCMTSLSPLPFSVHDTPTSTTLDAAELWNEVPVDGLYMWSQRNPKVHRCCPWPSSRIQLGRIHVRKTERRILRYGNPTNAAVGFLHYLRAALKKRVRRVYSDQTEIAGTCSVGILFSGGIDSVLLAAVLHESVDAHLSIELMNVTFDEKDASMKNSSRSPSPDRLAAISALRELQVNLSIFLIRSFVFKQ